jgi:transposase-like protein
MKDACINGAEARAIAREVGVSIEDLARVADINSQTFYRKKATERFGSKSTRKILLAAQKIAGRPIKVKAAV